MRQLPIAAFLSFTLAACGSDEASTSPPPVDDQSHDHDHSDGGHTHGQDPGEAAPAAADPAAPLFDGALLDSSRWNLYGAGVREGEAVPVAEVLADPAAFEGRPVRVKGPIATVCQVSGCWVRLGTESSNMFVRFKDYGFFLPKDAAGEAIVEGFVKVEEVSVDLQKHLLEDEGKHEEAAKITEPKISTNFEAHGVAIAKRD